MKNPAFIISLDFELFWGVCDSKTIDNYGKNIENEWFALPAMLSLFKRYDVHATWATVGMLICKDFEQWYDLRPSNIPAYTRKSLSTYSLVNLAREFPRLFFGRPLVEKILSTDGQELASHSYSHFYSSENGANIESFVVDMECNRAIFNDINFKPTSFVFPRNQVRDEYLSVLALNGFTAYRGNRNHWLYQHGSTSPRSTYGKFNRYGRFIDDYLSFTGSHTFKLYSSNVDSGVLNIPASRFLRPSVDFNIVDHLHLLNVKRGMSEAAKSGKIFHLWWHPHNFGNNTEINLRYLECILQHYLLLNQKYGMRSLTMRELTDYFI